MGLIYTYTETGRDGGTWYVAAYPLGATRYYRTEQARARALETFCGAVRATGGAVLVVDE